MIHFFFLSHQGTLTDEGNECYGSPKTLIPRQTWDNAHGMLSGGSRILCLQQCKADGAV